MAYPDAGTHVPDLTGDRHDGQRQQHGLVCSSSGESTFEFVVTTDLSKRDRDTQKLIRSHVMRDIGRARRRQGGRRRHHVLEIPLTITPAMFTPVVAGPSDEMLDTCQPSDADVQDESLSIERFGAGPSDPFIAYPIEMDVGLRQYVNDLFNAPSSRLREYEQSWFPLGLTGDAVFIQVLANFSVVRNLFDTSGRATSNYQSVVHHARAVELVRKKMSDSDDALGDGVLGAVLAMACYSHLSGNLEGWNTHINGAQKIVELRGGIDALGYNKLLCRTIPWVDINGACTLDVIPRFPCPIMMSGSDIPLSSQVMHICQSWQLHFPNHEEAICTLCDLSAFTTLLNQELVRTSGYILKDAFISEFWLYPLVHRLLSLNAPIDPEDTGSVLQEACRLAGLLCLAEVRRQWCIFPVITMRHVRKLKTLLQIHDIEWRDLQQLKVWVLAVAAMEADPGEEREWLLDKLTETLWSQGLRQNCAVEDILGGTAYVAEFHEGLLVALLNQCHEKMIRN